MGQAKEILSSHKFSYGNLKVIAHLKLEFEEKINADRIFSCNINIRQPRPQLQPTEKAGRFSGGFLTVGRLAKSTRGRFAGFSS